MEVPTQSFVNEFKRALKIKDDEIKRLMDENQRLKKHVAYYKRVLSIEQDTDPADELVNVASGEVLDVEN